MERIIFSFGAFLGWIVKNWLGLIVHVDGSKNEGIIMVTYVRFGEGNCDRFHLLV